MVARIFRVLVALVLVALSATGVSAESPTASDATDDAATAITPDEAFLFDARAYADAHEISLEEGIRRLELLPDFTRVRLDLETAAPTRFAGGWVEHWPQFQVVVRFKGTSELSPATAALIPGNLGIDVEFGAQHTLAELLAGQQKIIPTVYARYPDMGIGISVRSGAVRLTGPSVLTAKELSELEALAGVRVIAEVAPADGLDHTYGGKLMDVFIPPYVYSCTSGFTVKDAVSGITGVMTAGHCFPDDANITRALRLTTWQT
jgi:hypothetical protein